MSVNQSNPYPFEELLSTNTSPGVDAQFHLGNLLVNLLHKMNDKVDEFVSQHLFSVKIGDQKANIITFDLFTTQDDKVFCPTHHKPDKSMPCWRSYVQNIITDEFGVHIIVQQ